MQKYFQTLATWISEVTGSPPAFLAALFLVILWAVVGPLMHFSDTWQLLVSTLSSIVTFLMVFLIQYAQNKDTKALHLKLDELIRIHRRARNELVRVEDEPEDVIKEKIDEISEISKGKDTEENRTR